MTALSLDRVCLTLGDTEVLRDVSLHISAGEFVSVLGPSGAGKSTLFRLLTQEIAPDQGKITVEGKPLAPDARAFAYMPQNDALMPWRRVIDNVTLGLEVQGMRRSQARAKAGPLMQTFGLGGFDRHYPAQLSGGMRQRAALLRTVIQGRAIQLLDEPFGALDALTRMQMQRWLEHRWQAERWTTILITHDVREAVALSDRIYVLSRRPAQVIDEVMVAAPRPRLDRPLDDAARALEDRLLNTLLTQTED